MPASSNFQNAIREAQSSALVGPNVVNKALPYVGGGMVMTALGVLGGLSMQPMPSLGQAGSPLFFPLFIAAFIGEIVLFFMASSAANNANNAKALPLLSAFSLLTGFTLSGIVGLAYQVAGMGAIATAVIATGLTFVIASVVGKKNERQRWAGSVWRGWSWLGWLDHRHGGAIHRWIFCTGDVPARHVRINDCWLRNSPVCGHGIR